MFFGLVACSSDKEENEPEPVVTDVHLVSSSVAEGSEVDASLNEIKLTYSGNVSISSRVKPTLNDKEVTMNYATENGTKILTQVVVPVTLSDGTQYTLNIPEGALIVAGGSGNVKGVTLHFSTKEGEHVEVVKGTLCNTNATQEAKNLYDFLWEQNGKKVITGVMANVNNNNDIADWIYSITGKYPALTGYDFIHLPESGQNWIDYSDITPAKTQWDNNGIVTYMWHWRAPNSKNDYDAKNFSNYDSRIRENGEGTDFDIRNAVTEGTWEHDFIIEDIDRVAVYLKQLQDAGIPVLWRPLHEAAGSYKYASNGQTNSAWFWWGRYGDEPTKKLWNILYDRLVNHHHLNNLIWVWTAQVETEYYDRMVASYPGNDMVDIVCTDLYYDNHTSQKWAYDNLVRMTEGKRIVTIGETGMIQEPEACVNDGAAWSYFMLWYTYDIHKRGEVTDDFGNTPEILKKYFNSEAAITRDEMPSLK